MWFKRDKVDPKPVREPGTDLEIAWINAGNIRDKVDVFIRRSGGDWGDSVDAWSIVGPMTASYDGKDWMAFDVLSHWWGWKEGRKEEVKNRE